MSTRAQMLMAQLRQANNPYQAPPSQVTRSGPFTYTQSNAANMFRQGLEGARAARERPRLQQALEQEATRQERLDALATAENTRRWEADHALKKARHALDVFEAGQGEAPDSMSINDALQYRDQYTDESWAEFVRLQPEVGTAKAAEALRVRPELSSPETKALLSAQDNAAKSEQRVAEAVTLADEYAALAEAGTLEGWAGEAEELIRRVLGEEATTTTLRKRYAGLVNSAVMQNLPPGVASDRDIAFAREAFLPATADSATIARWLRGWAKMEQIAGLRDAHRAQYMSENKTAEGWLQDWQTNSEEIIMSRVRGLQPTTGGASSGVIDFNSMPD